MSAPAPVSFVDSILPAFQHGDPQVDSKPIEAENVGRVRALYTAVAQGDFDAVTAHLHGDVELEIHGSKINAFVGRWQGRDAVRDTVRKTCSQVEEQQSEVVNVVAQGDTVVVVGRAKGRYRLTGQRYDICWAHVFSFQDGLITGCRQITDSLPFLGSILR